MSFLLNHFFLYIYISQMVTEKGLGCKCPLYRQQLCATSIIIVDPCNHISYYIQLQPYEYYKSLHMFERDVYMSSVLLLISQIVNTPVMGCKYFRNHLIRQTVLCSWLSSSNQTDRKRLRISSESLFPIVHHFLSHGYRKCTDKCFRFFSILSNQFTWLVYRIWYQ